MRHLCRNFIENGKCIKCNKPEWVIYFPEFKHKIGSKIVLPLHFSNGGKEFFVLKKEKEGYVIGKNKEDNIRWFD